MSGKRSTVSDGVFSNSEVERGLLGCLLRRADDLAMVGDRNLFTEPRHLAIFDIIRELHATSGRVDVWCVIERLPEHRDYMLDLMDEDKNPGAVTPMPLIRMLSDCAIRRRLHSVAVTLQRRIADGDTPVELTDILREQLEQQSVAPPAGGERFFIDDEQIEQEPPLSYDVEGLIVAGTLNLIVADKGTYKTFLALDLALCGASGRAWLADAEGHGLAVRSGTTVFVAAEGQRGLRQRVKAWKVAHGVQGRAGLLFRKKAVNLLDEKSVLEFIAAVKCLPTPPVRAIFDTLNKCMIGGSENDPKEMGRAMESLERIRDVLGCTVIALHHVGHLEKMRARGHSSLPAGADTILMLTAEQDTIKLYDDKQRDTTKGHEFHLRPRVVELGNGESSCVLQSASAPSPSRDEYLPEGAYRTLKILVEETQVPGGEPLTFTEWRVATGQPKSSFSDQRTLLTKRGFVEKTHTDKYRPTAKGVTKIGGRRGPVGPNGSEADPPDQSGSGPEGTAPYVGGRTTGPRTTDGTPDPGAAFPPAPDDGDAGPGGERIEL